MVKLRKALKKERKEILWRLECLAMYNVSLEDYLNCYKLFWNKLI